MMRNSMFAPRRYNQCKSPGFGSGRIMPVRACFSAESQDLPTIRSPGTAAYFASIAWPQARAGGN